MKSSKRVHGKLHLHFASAGDRTVLSSEQQPPLQVVRAFHLPDRTALVHLHNLSGGVFGGDCLETNIQVGPEARAQVTSTGATRVYQTPPEAEPAFQSIQIHIAEGALLEYLPDPLIPFANSRYGQETRICLDPGAGLFYWETVAPGRQAQGESFEYDSLRIQLDLLVGEVPLALERIHLQPRQSPLASLSRLGPFSTFTTFHVCRVGVPAARWLDLEGKMQALSEQLTRPGATLWGASCLPAHGLVLRGLSRSGKDITTGLTALWTLAKQELYSIAAVPPRKT